MISKFARRIVFAFLLILLGAGIAVSQTATSSLRGIITDPKGSTVPGADVTLTSAERGVSLATKTDRDGQYQFLEVRPGTYTLEIAAPGFSNIRQTNLILLVATPARSDFQMTLASTGTTVEVTAALQTINTSDATIGNAFNQTQLSALPFEGRDPAGILSLQPGVVTIADRGKVDTNGDSRGGAVNGARSDQTNLTLDGIDNNDQVSGNAFVGALRTTLDSIEEFRVTTTNSDAESGRSSGAQVSLVTKSGTNQIHGAAYEYNRPTNLVANDYFNKHAQLANVDSAGNPDPLSNRPPRLLRNTFGGSFGGAIKKDRLYYFLAYEGQRTRESFQVSRIVPSAALRDGVIQYPCSPTFDADGNVIQTAVQNCPGGPGNSAQGISGTTYSPGPGFNALGPTQIATMDPRCTANGTCLASAGLNPGVNPFVLQTLNSYPQPNSDNVGDTLNYRGYTFSAPTPSKLDTYVAKFDYNLNSSGSQRLFVRLGLQNDHGIPTSVSGDQLGTNSGAPQFPGQGPSVVETNNSKGIVTGYTWVISPTKVNNFHYGFIRQGIGENGASLENFVILRGLDTPVADNRTTSKIVPVHNFTDDFSWSRGRHTFSFGGNYRIITNERNSNANSFTRAITNAAFLIPTGIAGTGQSFDPAAFSFPAVDPDFSNSYDFPIMALSGVVNEIDTVYVQTKAGQLIASPDSPGAFVARNFRDNEAEFYVQDSWHAKSNLTFTYGLRYSLLQPPYERGGNQVSPSISLDNFFKTRMSEMVKGNSFSPDFDMVLSGPANGKPGYWDWDYKNFAPRLSMAYSPNFSSGLLASIFGGPGKSSIRVGAGMYYDHFGQGTVDIYDQNGSFGFVSNITQPPGFVNLDTGPRYTGLHDFSNLQSMIFPAPTSLGFPQTPPEAFGIYWSLDDKMKTPYSYALDLSITRELRNGFTLEVAYVGRISRRLLQEKDLAQPINLCDPKSGLCYFQAVTALAKAYRANPSTQAFNPASLPANVQQYWTDIMQPLQQAPNAAYQTQYCTGIDAAKNPILFPTTNPITAAFDLFCGGSLNETTPLSTWDTGGIPDARNAPDCDTEGNPACVGFYFPKNSQSASGFGPFSFYQAQYASLNAWTSTGRANYNALQVMLRKRATRGLTFDFNYTFSKSIDLGSAAERVATFQGSFYGLTAIYNPFSPGLFRSVSDFDMTHQINSNWVYDLPFGRKQRWGANWNRGLDAVLGGWSWSGLYKWTSGLPFGVQNGFQFPTNWDLNGYANLIGQKPTTGAFNGPGGNINMFKDPAAAINAFDFPFPGQVGSRNVLRGPGYFTVDTSVRKTWNITERQSLTFSAQAYNLTNSVRFDTFSALPEIDISGSFGNYTHTLNGPRVMEFALRYSF